MHWEICDTVLHCTMCIMWWCIPDDDVACDNLNVMYDSVMHDTLPYPCVQCSCMVHCLTRWPDHHDMTPVRRISWEWWWLLLPGILTQRYIARRARQDERRTVDQPDSWKRRDQCTYVYTCIDPPIHHNAMYSTVLYYTSVIYWSYCTVSSHAVYCVSITDVPELYYLICTVLIGLYSTSMCSTVLPRIMLHSTIILCCTPLCTHIHTILRYTVLHCTVMRHTRLHCMCCDNINVLGWKVTLELRTSKIMLWANLVQLNEHGPMYP